MEQVKIYHDHTGNTLTVWFGNPQEVLAFIYQRFRGYRRDKRSHGQWMRTANRYGTHQSEVGPKRCLYEISE
jgi:hypothetical protein